MVFSLLVSVVALIFAGYLAKVCLASKAVEPPRCNRSRQAIREGAEAFLKRQYRTIGLMTLGLAVLMFIFYGFLKGWDTSAQDDVCIRPGGCMLGALRVYRDVHLHSCQRPHC